MKRKDGVMEKIIGARKGVDRERQEIKAAMVVVASVTMRTTADKGEQIRWVVAEK